SFSRYDAPYYLARLAGKLVNAVADIPPDEIVSTSELKAAVTGDQLEARRPRGEPFTFRPRAGHIFSANELPGTLDQTQGFWRRMIVIRFGRKFTGEPIRNLGARILENERPGLFAWALDGARRVRVQGRYTVPEVVLSEVQKWRHDSDQVSIFLVDETIANDEAQSWTSAGDVFERYRKWASSTGHGQMSKSKFGKRLKLLCASRRSKNGIEYAVTLRTRV
ncbi:MAG: hypothetical protein GTO41_22970, partial [Burkholderiales bacterium]|nr:hypothetical protein [Burkholderiales bacterium]